MWSTDDEWTLFRLERELSQDEGVRRALEALDWRRRTRLRRWVVTVVGAITALAVVGAGQASSLLGVTVLLLVGLAVGETHREARRCRPDSVLWSFDPP